MTFRPAGEFNGQDYEEYVCDCGWSTLVPAGADVACCPRCIAREAENVPERG